MILKSLDLAAYCRDLVRRFEVDTVPGTDFTLKNCFVPLRMYKIDGENIFEETVGVIETIDQWLAKAGNYHLSIVGEYGQGKSTALLAYCARWARAHLEGEESGCRIPLLIELRGRSPSRQGPAEFLNEWGMRHDLNGEALYNLVRAGGALLVFEGFDEIQDAGRRWDRFRQFDALWHFAFPSAKIIFTGRPNFFLDDAETLKLLRIDRASVVAGRSGHGRLSPGLFGRRRRRGRERRGNSVSAQRF